MKSNLLPFLSQRILSKGEKGSLTSPCTHIEALSPFSLVNCRMVKLASVGAGTYSEVTSLSTHKAYDHAPLSMACEFLYEGLTAPMSAWELLSSGPAHHFLSMEFCTQ